MSGSFGNTQQGQRWRDERALVKTAGANAEEAYSLVAASGSITKS
jgi:hypothetical protein